MPDNISKELLYKTLHENELNGFAVHKLIYGKKILAKNSFIKHYMRMN